MNEKIIIPLSKAKIIISLIGTAVFVTLGILFILNPATFISPAHKNSIFIQIAGMAAVLFFGVCFLFVAKKLFNNEAGLIIDNDGITDNSNATSIGLIEWQDIVDIQVLEIASTKIIIPITDKPQKYIGKAKKWHFKKGNESQLQNVWLSIIHYFKLTENRF